MFMKVPLDSSIRDIPGQLDYITIRGCTSLFKDLALGVGVLLAVDSNGLVPLPHGLDVGAVLGVLGVELGELVRLPIGSNVESMLVVVTTDGEGTADNGVIVNTVDGGATEDVLAGSLKTGEETTNQVGGHEGLGELVIVLVLDGPQSVLVLGNLLPEVLHGLGLVVVGVESLPLIERVGRAGEEVNGVLGLGLSGHVVLLIHGLGLGLGGSLGLLGLGGSLLLGGLVLESGLLDELEGVGNVRVDLLVVDGLVPARDVGVLGTPLLVEEELEAAGDDADGEQVSEGDALANEEGVVQQVLLNNVDGLGGGLLGVINGLLVVGVPAQQGAVPGTEVGENLHVEEGSPLQDGSVVLLGLAEQSGLLILGSDYSILVSLVFSKNKTKFAQDWVASYHWAIVSDIEPVSSKNDSDRDNC
jgi:hypothetical protein